MEENLESGAALKEAGYGIITALAAKAAEGDENPDPRLVEMAVSMVIVGEIEASDEDPQKSP